VEDSNKSRGNWSSMKWAWNEEAKKWMMSGFPPEFSQNLYENKRLKLHALIYFWKLIILHLILLQCSLYESSSSAASSTAGQGGSQQIFGAPLALLGTVEVDQLGWHLHPLLVCGADGAKNALDLLALLHGVQSRGFVKDVLKKEYSIRNPICATEQANFYFP
jgi:hypothetical protein